MVKLLIAFFQQKTSERNGSEVTADSNEFAMDEESRNPDIINNANLNIFSITVCLASGPVHIQAMRSARTECEHKLVRGEVAELPIVVAVSVVLGDSLGVPGGVNAGGQDGQLDDDDAATYTPHAFFCGFLVSRHQDRQLSSFESFQFQIQQYLLLRFSNSSSEKGNRSWQLLFKANFVALNIWQDFISETSAEGITILHVVLIKFTILLKTHFSFAVAGTWSPEVQASSSLVPQLSSPGASPPSSSSSSLPPLLLPSAPWHPGLRTNSSINAFFTSPSCLEVGELAVLSIGGWRQRLFRLQFCTTEVQVLQKNL